MTAPDNNFTASSGAAENPPVAQAPAETSNSHRGGDAEAAGGVQLPRTEIVTMKALSIRQPWAWLIVNGFKDIENRVWRAHFRGRILIHASKGMTEDEYLDAFALAKSNGVMLPPAIELQRGGMVGSAEITDCVTRSESPWFFGPFGFVMSNARPLKFAPCKGKLGFFDVQVHSIGGALP